jgi:hypothetical protein
MRVLILVLCFFVLVLGSFANAQVKEMKLSGCILKSSSSVNNVLNRMTSANSHEYIANKASNTIVEIKTIDGITKSYTYKLVNINTGYAEGIQDNGIRRDVKNQPYLQEWMIVKLYYDKKEAEVEFHYKDIKKNTTEVNNYEYLCNSKKSS